MHSSEVIAGSEPGDFTLVRHVRLGGSQREIGHNIAELAWSNRVRPQPSSDPTLTRARRVWRTMHWPELEERAAGVADRWNLELGDNRRNWVAVRVRHGGRMFGGVAATGAHQYWCADADPQL